MTVSTAIRARFHEQRLSLYLQTLLAFESSLYSVLTPILPHYVQSLGASKADIGILTGAYTAGLLPAAVLGGWMASRGGVRRTTFVGIVLFALSVGSFGFAGDLVVLDVLRAIQGFGSGLIWAGGITWLIATASPTRRGRVIGAFFSAAILGTLLGPAIGTAAVPLGTGVVFGALGLIALALAAGVLRHGEPEIASRGPRLSLRRVFRNRALLLGLWLMLLEAGALAVVYALVPLRLSHFGASSSLIGATFVAGSAIRTFVAPQVGRASDRRGAIAPTIFGLLLASVTLAALPVPRSVGGLVVISTIVMAGPLTTFVIPAASLLSVAAERAGIGLAVAAMFLNFTWAAGQTIGAPVGAALAQATSDAVPFFALSALLLLSVALTFMWRRDPLVAQATAPLEQPSAPRAVEAPCESGRAHAAAGGRRPAELRQTTRDDRF